MSKETDNDLNQILLIYGYTNTRSKDGGEVDQRKDLSERIKMYAEAYHQEQMTNMFKTAKGAQLVSFKDFDKQQYIDECAAKVLPAVMSGNWSQQVMFESIEQRIAFETEEAYMYADAMYKVREDRKDESK